MSDDYNDEFSKPLSNDTLHDGIHTCAKCGRELEPGEYIWCSDCDADD